MNVIIIVLATIASAILYRAGGMGKEPDANPKWMPMWMRDTKARDVGCSLILVGLAMALFGVSSLWYLYILAFGLSWGALASYWGQDSKPYGFWAHGLGCGIAGIPLIWCGAAWWIVVLRLAVCVVGMAVWSEKQDVDWKEEMGRGVLFIL